MARALRALWVFLGRLGLALRHLLALFFQLLLAPLRALAWLFHRLLMPPARFAGQSLGAFAHWLFLELPRWTARGLLGLTVRSLQNGFRSAPDRAARIRLRLRSAWLLWRSRLWLYLRRPMPPDEAILIPRIVSPAQAHLRLNPVTAALVTTSVVLLAGYLTSLARPEGEPAVYRNQPSAAIVKVSPAPTLTPTPMPSPTPSPTPEPTAVVAEQPQAWPTPDPLSKGGTVAFSLRQNGNTDLYALTIGRAEPIRLTAHAAEDRDPAWSPDGRRLAFASHRDGNWDIYVLDLATAELQRITKDPAFDGAPAWSPDGQWLVFESYREQNLDLYVAAAAGDSAPIRLTEDQAADFSPAWSPEGRHIAFASRRGGNNDIYTLSLDAVSDADAINLTISPDREEDQPTFSPDGRQLAFVDRSDRFELVYVLPVESGRPTGPAGAVGQGRHPSYSPDGSALVYAFQQGERGYIIAGGRDVWNVAPQAFVAQGVIDDLTWSGLVLPPGLEERLAAAEVAQDAPLFVESLSPSQDSAADQERYLLWRLGVDAPSPYLSDRVDQSFEALRQAVIAAAGWDFLDRLDNMYASLATRPLPGQPQMSWNMAGRAFDFYYRHPLAADPQVEIVREDRGAQTYWRVYLRAAAQDGSLGEPLRQLPWDFSARYESDPRYYSTGGNWKAAIPAGYYVDFTALAADYGWLPVPAADNWRTFFQGIGYWHFENRQGLTLDQAMAEIYTPEELEAAFGNR